jgi:hypothetical protein
LPCGCCEGITGETPAAIGNRPGLGAIAYRSGTWARFKSSMLADLSTSPALAGLRTRSDDDFSIALLDAWAVVCDILTFYQERIANEAYLRTATELVSIGELAKLIGYKLRPGLAAAAPLAFSLAAPPAAPAGANTPPSGAPSSVAVATGTAAQTVPDPGAQPATFETVAAIAARAEWNAVGVRLTVPPAASGANAKANLRLAGLVTTVKVGDSILVVSGGTTALNRVASVSLDTATQTTVVRFEAGAAQAAAALPTTVAAPPASASLGDDFLWSNVKSRLWGDQGQLVAFATTQGWSLDQLEAAVNALRGVAAPGAQAPVAAYAMGTDAAVFGHNAPDYDALPLATQSAIGGSWEGDTIGSNASTAQPWLDLDNVYPVTVGDQVALVAWITSYGAVDIMAATFGGGSARSVAATAGSAISRRTEAESHRLGAVHTGGSSGLEAMPSYSGWVQFFTKVTDVQVVSRSAYLLASKITSISLAGWPTNDADFAVRGTRVLVETPPPLAVADAVLDPVDGPDLATADTVLGPVGGGQLMLDGAYLTLTVGQLVAVTGTSADTTGQTTSEVVAITGLSLVDGYTVLQVSPQLSGTYVRASVTVNANVAPATDGVTTSEILGSGDSSQAFQRFALKQAPLTYVSAATPSGAASTLTVRVDGVEWSEVPWLYGSQPTDRVYAVVRGSDGRTYVQFGDGVTGARPGTGSNNVVANYRYGIGSAGLARPGQISTLLTRSYGLNAVTNPSAASGATDPETVVQARVNAPVSVMTVGRIVALEDVGFFAAASAGITKAAVHWVWDGSRFVACATVAGTGGAPVLPGSSQYTNLLAAMLEASDGTLPIALCSYQSVTFSVGAAVTPDPALDPDAVLVAVKSALADAFSFDRRAFGQPVYASEVIEVVQGVTGVVAMTLGALAYSGTTPATVPDALPASAPTLGPSGLAGAELLTLEPGLLTGVVLAS